LSFAQEDRARQGAAAAVEERERLFARPQTAMPAVSNARGLVDQYKDRAHEEVYGGYARDVVSTILGYSLPGTRRSIMEKLESEAQEAYKTQHYEVALDRFAHYLALVETDPSTTMVSEMRATLTSNIGACLHHLGDTDGAIEYYERALQEFKAVPFTVLSRLSVIWVVYGNLIDKRVEYVEKKLASIRAGEPPDGSTYQDGYGKSRKWTAEEMDGKKAFSIWRPRSWFGYGRLQEVGIAAESNTAPNGV